MILMMIEGRFEAAGGGSSVMIKRGTFPTTFGLLRFAAGGRN